MLIINKTKENISRIIDTLLTILKPFTAFITSNNGKYFIIAYLVFIIITAYLIQVYRTRKIAQQTYIDIINNTSRSKAIESFNNYNKQIIEKLDKDCQDILDESINKSNNNDLSKDLIQKEGLFYFNNIEELYKSYVTKNLINKNLTQQTINNMDNIILNLDTELSATVSKYTNNLLNLINNNKGSANNNALSSVNISDSELKYLRIDKINDIYKTITNVLESEIISNLETKSISILQFTESDSVSISETALPEFIKNELYERFYYVIYNDYKDTGIFKQLCQLRNKLTKLNLKLTSAFNDSYDTDTARQNIILNLEKEITNSKAEYVILQNKYELYLRTLSLFSTSKNTVNKLKKELVSIASTDIQPANQNVIDYLNAYKNNVKSKLTSTPMSLTDNEEETKAEYITTTRLNDINKQYEDELHARNSDTRLDIPKIFSNLEENVIGFLSDINNSSRNINTINTLTNNTRLGNETSTRGTFLYDMNTKPNTTYEKDNYYYKLDTILNSDLSNKMNLNTNSKEIINTNNTNIDNNKLINNNNNMNNNSKPSIEGFEDIPTNNKDTVLPTKENTILNNKIYKDIPSNNLLEQLVLQFLGVTKNMLDNDMIKSLITSGMKLLKLDNIKSTEQLGVLFIIGSILLFFIDLSS